MFAAPATLWNCWHVGLIWVAIVGVAILNVTVFVIALYY